MKMGSEYKALLKILAELNMVEFWLKHILKCLELCICLDSEYTRVLNTPSVQRVLCKFFVGNLQIVNKLRVVNMKSGF